MSDAQETRMRPRDVTDTGQFLTMESDNHPGDSSVWSILHNGDHVSLHAPAGGGSRLWVSIPTDQFNAIVDWYTAEQKVSEEEPA